MKSSPLLNRFPFLLTYLTYTHKINIHTELQSVYEIIQTDKKPLQYQEECKIYPAISSLYSKKAVKKYKSAEIKQLKEMM